jgi:polar amino acid transport system permease protein
VVVFAALALIIVNAPGWPKVKHAFFDPAEFRAYFATIGHAFVLNIKIFLVAEVLILTLAMVLAVLRSLPGPVFLPIRLLAIGYTDLFRGIPTILLVLLFGFGIPTLQLSHVTRDPVYLGAAALVVIYTAYVSEVYRAGINGVHRSQVAAARSLGLTQWSSMRYVILPQAIRNIIPPLLNDFISLQKDTALVGLLGAIEANKAAEIYSSTVFNYSSYVVAAILFLILTIPLARFTDHLIRRDQARRLAGAGQLWAERARFPFPVQGTRKRCGSRGCASRSARTRCSAGWTWPSPRTRSSA